MRRLAAGLLFMLVMVPVNFAIDGNHYVAGALFGMWGWAAVGAATPLRQTRRSPGAGGVTAWAERETAALIAEASLAAAADVLALSDDPQLAAIARSCLSARAALRSAFDITDPDADEGPEP